MGVWSEAFSRPRTAVPSDVTIERLDHYLFQIAGPTSLG